MAEEEQKQRPIVKGIRKQQKGIKKRKGNMGEASYMSSKVGEMRLKN